MYPVLKLLVVIFVIIGVGSLVTSLVHFIKIRKDKNHENKN